MLGFGDRCDVATLPRYLVMITTLRGESRWKPKQRKKFIPFNPPEKRFFRFILFLILFLVFFLSPLNPSLVCFAGDGVSLLNFLSVGLVYAFPAFIA